MDHGESLLSCAQFISLCHAKQSNAKPTSREHAMHSWPCSCGVDARHYSLQKLAFLLSACAIYTLACPRLECPQFSLEELTAIVEEATNAGTYVCAHAYMPTAIKRALAAGVRSIEHGNWLDEECAQMMVAAGAYLVPTLATYAALRREGVAAGMAPELVEKVGAAVEQVGRARV